MTKPIQPDEDEEELRQYLSPKELRELLEEERHSRGKRVKVPRHKHRDEERE